MADDHDAHLRQHDEIMKSLTAMLVQQQAFNARQVEINADIKTTLARVETLLARLIPQSDNGRDA
jgi:hypothetical protein